MQTATSTRSRWGYVAVLFIWITTGLGADSESETQKQLRELRQQNEGLQQQLRKQQEQIEKLTRKVSGLEFSTPSHKLDAETERAPPGAGLPPIMGKVKLSGEGGFAFFQYQSRGRFPKAEVRVDEAKLFVDAPVWKDVYFFSEINIATRESGGFGLNAGELY